MCYSAVKLFKICKLVHFRFSATCKTLTDLKVRIVFSIKLKKGKKKRKTMASYLLLRCLPQDCTMIRELTEKKKKE